MKLHDIKQVIVTHNLDSARPIFNRLAKKYGGKNVEVSESEFQELVLHGGAESVWDRTKGLSAWQTFLNPKTARDEIMKRNRELEKGELLWMTKRSLAAQRASLDTQRRKIEKLTQDVENLIAGMGKQAEEARESVERAEKQRKK